jgi:hypothetical protein
MRPPLIVDEHGDVELFRDAAALEGYLEAIDVQNNEYIVYDSDGRRVELTTAEVPTRALFGLLKGTADAVRIAGSEVEPTHAIELAVKLREALERLGEAVPLEAPLAELLERLRGRLGFVA